MKNFALKLVQKSPRLISKIALFPNNVLISVIPNPYRLATFFFLLKDYKKSKEIVSKLLASKPSELDASKDIYSMVLFRISLALMIVGAMKPAEVMARFGKSKFAPGQLRLIAEDFFGQFKSGQLSFRGSSSDAKGVSEVFNYFFSLENTGKEIGFYEVLNLLQNPEQIGFKFNEVLPERVYTFVDPKLFGNNQSESIERKVVLPHFGMCEVTNAQVREASSVFKDNAFLLYDLGGPPKNGRTAGTSYYFWQAEKWVSTGLVIIN